MKIVIIGSGEVGVDLARMLSRENHDVTILDKNRTALVRSIESNDILAIEGSGTSAVDLLKAGVNTADLVIAATSLDEINMVASMMSKRLGAAKVIARIRNEEFSAAESPINPSDLGIDVIINPELSVAGEILHLVKRAAASDVIELANGQMQVIGIRIEKTAPIIGISLEEYAARNANIDFRIVAILRGGITIVPRGNEKIRANDHIFVIALNSDIKQIIRSTGISERNVHHIMIAGGSPVGRRVAQLLSEVNKNWDIKLIEPDYDTSYRIASENPEILVLQGDPTDPGLLATEGISDMDVFIAVTDDEESNIISCLMAKHLGVSKVIALVSKPNYIPLTQTIGLDSSVNKKTAAANEIHRHVRGKHLLQSSAMNGLEAEIIAIQIGPKCRFAHKTLADIHLPNGCVVGGIISNDIAKIATGDSTLKLGDTALLFCRSGIIEDVTRLFG